MIEVEEVVVELVAKNISTWSSTAPPDPLTTSSTRLLIPATNTKTPDNMQFTYLAMALFATIALGAPAAAPSDIFDIPADVEPVQFTGPNGNPVPQTCCVLTRYGNLKCDSRKRCP